MACWKCSGFTVAEKAIDMNDLGTQPIVERCINCGSITDSVIKQNRSASIARLRRVRFNGRPKYNNNS